MTTYLPIFVCNEITETLFPNYFHDANTPIFKRKRFTKRNEKKKRLAKVPCFFKMLFDFVVQIIFEQCYFFC
jgi:hypothetical protein